MPDTVRLSIPELSIQIGQSISIPISIDAAEGIESLDLHISYDSAIFTPPTTGSLITAGSLNAGSAFVVNNNPPGQVAISWAGTSPLPPGSGSIATLNLDVKADAEIGSTLIDLVSASINEDVVNAELIDGSITLLHPSFQIAAIRQIPNGLALQLPEAPDLEALNLYDGPDASMDVPDLQLTSPSAQPVALSAHWQESTNELLLLADEPLTDGSYTLNIDSCADGLISASAGELLDGNGDGTGGDAFSTSFTYTAPEHSLSIADTARGAGQSLNLNGRNTHDSLTGAPLADSNGLPIHLSTSTSLTSLSGSLSFDSSLLLHEQLESALTAGADLPGDWNVQLDPSSTPGQLQYSASGTTAITGDDQEILRFHATVAAAAAPPARGTTGNGLYGSSTLISASLTSDQLTGETIAIDPGLVVLAYSGDTTGNGTLSSLDASRIQQQVVGLPVNSFPDLPDTPISDPLG